MSKRGRRRYSRRRRSSSSSKQSVTSIPYISYKQDKNNSVGYKHDVLEKREKECVGKEKVPSASDDDEKHDNASPREKRLKPGHHITSFPNQSTYITTTEHAERAVKIVTSVSVDNMEDTPPKITFWQSREPLSENPHQSATPLTNILNINWAGPHMKLEIKEITEHNTDGINTTVIVINEKEDNTERFGKNEDDQRPNNEQQFQHVTDNQSQNASNYILSMTEDTTKNNLKSATSSPGDSQRAYPDEQLSKYPPSLMNITSRRKKKLFCKSFSTDYFWDAPPPQTFADMKCRAFEALVSDLDSCRISSCGKADTAQKGFDQVPVNCDEESGPAFYDEVKEKTDKLSESDKSTSMRPLLSTKRSSFTKDFVKCQKRKSRARHNSVATVEHKERLFPQRRRQTFPSISTDPSLKQDLVSYESSSSGTISPWSQLKSLGISNLQRKHFHRMPLCMSCTHHPENAFTVSEQRQEQNKYRDPDDFGERAYQGEVTDSGFDQELGELDCHIPEPSVGRFSSGALTIQVIPPSCSGSEEHVVPSRPKSSNQNSKGENSMVNATTGLLKQNFLMESKLGFGTCMQGPSMSTLQYLDAPSQSTLDDTKRKALTENDNLSPSLRVEKTRDPQLDEGSCCSEASAKPSASFVANGFFNTDTKIHEFPNESERPDKKSITRCSPETKEHLRLLSLKGEDSGTPDSWARRRKLFKDSKTWSSAGGSSFTSDMTEESAIALPTGHVKGDTSVTYQENILQMCGHTHGVIVSEDVYSTDLTIRDTESKGFYAETFHSAAWLYQGESDVPGSISPSLNTRTRAVSMNVTFSVRERTVKINKGTGEYPWGFRIQFSKPIVVTEVDTNGAAEEAGLMVGDYVLAVNATDVTSISHSEAATLARQGPEELTLTIGSDIGHVPNTPRPACRGYLHKRTRSGLIRGWRKRWFVLTHDCWLYYYRHKRDEGKSQALAAFKMEGAEVGPDLSLGKPFVFKCHPLSANRVYYLCATSNQEMKRWLGAMERALHPVKQHHVWVDVTRHNSSLPPLAVKNPECLGLLHKMDKSKDTWVQHYSILKDGCLYLYSGIRATHAHGGIYLQGYMVREQNFGGKKSTIELKPPSEEFKTFYFCADNPNETKRWILAFKASINKWLPLHQALQDYMSRPPDATRM